MARIITRAFDTAGKAEAAMDKLRWAGLPRSGTRVFAAHHGDAATLQAKMEKARIDAATAAAYVRTIGAGGAVVMVTATYKPLGAARITHEVLADFDTVDVGDLPQDVKVPDQPDHAPSILKDHPRLLTLPSSIATQDVGLVSVGAGWPLVSRKPRRSKVYSGGRYMSRAFWPQALTKPKRRANSAISGGRYMSRAFWPMKLISTRPRRISVIRGGALPFSRALGLSPLSY